ncbi:MAG: VWA domain-containing protein [Planctomycetes bacterium]|nr:VWA domain-containing protein [Planctomycetota bacterium]
MTLLAPWALWFLLTGGAVVALYLLKIRRQRQSVPSLDFWLALAGPLKPRSLFQRLKRWLSMALWLLIVVSLVLAIGNPVLSLGTVKPQSIAIIIDNSASMQSVDDPKRAETRLRRAIASVGEMVDRRPVDDEWLLIDSGYTPRVAQSWTRDRRSIRDAADAIRPHLGSTDLNAAVRLARQLLEGKSPQAIVIMTDGAAGEAARLAESDASITVWPIGEADDNLGITLLRVRPHRQQAQHFAFLRVANASKSEVQSQVVLELDGATIAVEPFTVAAEWQWEKAIPISASQGGVLRAWIDRPDVLPLDNEAFAILEPLRPARVVLVSDDREAYFFEQALLAMDVLVDSAESQTLTLADYESSSAAAKDPADLTIFNNCAPKNTPESGAIVFVNRWPEDLPIRINGTLSKPALSLVRRDHPLMEYITLGAASVTEAHDVTLTDRATVLADAGGASPLVFVIQQPGRTALCVGFDVLQSDLPVRNAFPILLRNAVVHLVAEQDAWVRDQYRVGEAIESIRPLPASVGSVTVIRGKPGVSPEQTLPVRDGLFRYDDTGHAGPVRLRFGEEAAYCAVNLTDEAETRIAPPQGLPAPEERLGLSQRLFSAVPWLALAVFAAGLIGLEWLTYHYRWTE